MERSWNLYAAWDEALCVARMRAACHRTKYRVRRSSVHPRLWLVEAAA